MPRCGVEDKRNPKPVEHSRFRRYIPHGKINHKILDLKKVLELLMKTIERHFEKIFV